MAATNTLVVPWLAGLIPGAAGVPSPREERWKYTNLRAVTALASPEAASSILPAVLAGEAALPNGWNWGAVRLPSNVVALRESRAAVDGDRGRDRALQAVPWDGLDDIFAAAPKPRYVQVASGQTLRVDIDHAAAGLGVDVLRIDVAAGATLELSETFGSAAQWLCQGLVLNIEAGAKVFHRVEQDLPTGAVLTRREVIAVADGANYTRGTVQRGAALSRFEPLIQAGAQCFVKLVTLQQTGWNDVRGQLHDTTAMVVHMGPGTRTEIRQRNVADGDGLAVFQGKFYVAQVAQQTDAYMLCQNMLLSDSARAHHKPELEIYADDVKCSHGASTGGIDDQQLFYLTARGIDPLSARKLLLEGFVQEMLDDMPLGESDDA